MSYLSQHMIRMRNDELIGLAKNRFLDEEDQLNLAKHPYRRAKMYLCDNPGLQPQARDYIWSLRGYAFKTDLIRNGHYVEDTSKYYELYNDYKQHWSRSAWRFQQALVYSYWTPTGALKGASGTPSELLNILYDAKIKPHQELGHYVLKNMASHPNCDLSLAIKLSQHPASDVSRAGFDRIVELSGKK